MVEVQHNDEEVVKAFKIFIKKVIHNAAIDFARKVRRIENKNVTISLNEYVDKKVSLSNYDNDAFFSYSNIEKISTMDFLKRRLNCISKREKQILIDFYIEKMTIKEIAEKLGTTENCIKATKSRCLKKMRNMEEK